MKTFELALKKRRILAYGLLGFPVAFGGLPIYLHAPDFYAQYSIVSLLYLSVFILLLRVFDAFVDPIIGLISDYYSSQRFYLLGFGLIILSIGMFRLFIPEQGFWGFAIAMLLVTLGYSIAAVNIAAAGAVMTLNSKEQSRLVTCREFFMVLGLIAASIIPALNISPNPLGNFFGYGALPYWLMASTLVALLLIVLCFRAEKEVANETLMNNEASRVTFSWRNNIQQSYVSSLRVVKAANPLFWIYSFSALGSALPAVLFLAFVRQQLVLEAYTGLFLLIYLLSAMASMPLWYWLGVRLGHWTSWALGIGLAVLSFIVVPFLGAGDGVLFAGVCLGSGIALGAELSMPFIILAGCLTSDRRSENTKSTMESTTETIVTTDADKQPLKLNTTTSASASLVFALFSFCNKICLALATFFGFSLIFLLDTPYEKVGVDSLFWFLPVFYGLIPSVFKAVAFIILIWSLWQRHVGKGELVFRNEVTSV